MTEQAPAYPVNLLVHEQPTLVVGGDNHAFAKITDLLRAGASVTVVAPQISDEIRALAVRIFERDYQRGEVASYRLAIICTDDADVSAQVHRDAEAAGVWSNSANDPANSTFTLPHPG